MLLGNHELYDMQGGYGIISKADFDSFGGYMNREKELSMEGKFGELLRKEMNITMVVDDNLFIHAGYLFFLRKKNMLNNIIIIFM